MTPEQEAREEIDDQLHQTGWAVQNASEMDISAAVGVAVREFPLETGFADYLLYADAKALGTIEAKPKGHTLTGVETQSGKYSKGLPAGLPHFHLPLPFAYESTGSVTQFTNLLDPHARSREIFTFHRPEELIRLATLESQLRCNLQRMPELITTGLWNVQVEAIRNLELSLAANHPRAVIQMATGSGKTFTAGHGQLSANKVRQGQADSIPGRSQQPGPADEQRVPAVRQPLQQPQVHRGIRGPAPPPQHDRPGRQGLHHHHPAAVFDPQR